MKSKNSVQAKWNKKKLGELCEKITDGSHNPPRGIDFSEFLMLSSKNIINGRIIFDSPRYLSETDFISENKRTNIQVGDVLLTIVGTIGRTALVESDEIKFTLQRSVAVLRNKKELITSKFLLFSLNNIFDQMNEQSRGVAQKGLYLDQIRNIEIALPSIEEQERIVKILDEVFENTEKTKRNTDKIILKLELFFQIYLKSIYSKKREGWLEKSLDGIATIKGGKRLPKNAKLLFEKTLYPYIRVTDFNNQGSIDLEKVKYISEDTFQRIKNYTISSNDLYLSIAGTIGKTGLVPEELSGANLTENACKLVFKANINPKFIYFFTKTDSFLSQAGLNTRVAAMPKLALSRLATIQLYFPENREEQDTIVSEIEQNNSKISRVISIYREKVEKLESLRKSILQKAFAGEL